MFSWEFAWPKLGATNAGDISLDTVVRDGAAQHLKSYMMRKFRGCDIWHVG